MKDFNNQLSNDDPGGKISQLRGTWYIAFALIASNLPYWFAIQYFYRVGLMTEMASVAVAMIFSLLYHTCQTTGLCDHLGLERWTVLDHISAASLLAVLAIATVNSHNIDRALEKLRLLLEKPPPPRPYGYVEEAVVIPVGAYVEDVRRNYKWTNAITYTYLFVVILSTVCHPFSMQNNLIVLSVGMAIVFIKLTVIDNGDPESFLARISLPDLIVGLVLIAIALVYFVLDGYIYYWQFHSLWHAFSSVGIYFYAAGITKDLLFSYSPTLIFWEKVCCASRKKRAKMRQFDPSSPY
jgi:hypothetical protein